MSGLRSGLFGWFVKVAVWVYGRFDIRARWLAHWLLGNGESWTIPEEIVREAIPPFHAQWYAEMAGEPVKFSGTLFWLVGTATYEAEQDDRGITFRGADKYDWHPNRLVCLDCGAWGMDILFDGEEHYCGECGSSHIEGEWWWSPTALPGWVAKVVRFIWPEAREFIDVGDTGKTAISNGFWPFLGGTDFWSRFQVSYTWEEIQAAQENNERPEYQEPAAYEEFLEDTGLLLDGDELLALPSVLLAEG